MLPLTALVAGGALDLARFNQLATRADRVAISLADLASRAEAIRDRPTLDADTRNGDTAVFFELARQLASPESLDDGGGVVIASLTASQSGNTVNWRRESSASAAGSDDRLRAIPDLPEDMDFIVVEAVLPFDAVVLGADGVLGVVSVPDRIRRMALFRPRTGRLTELAP